MKPQNIFITNNGKIKLLDFGLSKLIDFTSITSTGDTIGSPVYMSPEQVKDSKNVDYRSDYYALGVILFELIAKEFPYGEVSSREHLYYKIIHEPPLSILQFEPLTPNCIDNLIMNLLSKKNYQRPNNTEEILYYLNQMNVAEVCKTMEQFEPNFFLRVWNEKKTLMGYYDDGFQAENIVFPINHQSGQKGLLNHIMDNNINFIIDPSTMRLAYDTFADVKGLAALPYAPQDFTRLELDNFIGLEQKKEYIRLVIQEQLKHNPSCIVSPFELQNATNKPVIAGRVGSIGLLLLAFGLYGFESGAARFESFYEDLYKEATDSYNMYIMYYMPELLRNIPVERKNPSKIIGILKTKAGIDLRCDCPYCSGKNPEELIQVEADTRRHFLYKRQEEIEMLRSLTISERLDYMEERIEKAIVYYRELTPIFKETDYGFLKTWQRIIPELRKHYDL